MKRSEPDPAGSTAVFDSFSGACVKEECVIGGNVVEFRGLECRVKGRSEHAGVGGRTRELSGF